MNIIRYKRCACAHNRIGLVCGRVGGCVIDIYTHIQNTGFCPYI
jgi:hypothetical protein